MADKGTMQDHIDDLLELQTKMFRQLDALRTERDKWKKVSFILASHISNTTSDLPASEIVRDAEQEATHE